MDAKLRFKAVREHFNMSMRSFGEQIGLTASGVSAIEYGTRNMSEKHIKLICAAFPSVSEEWLRTGEGEMIKQDANEVSDGYSPLIREILRSYERLSPQNKIAFERYLDFLLENQEN